MDNLNKNSLIYRDFAGNVFMETWGQKAQIHREDGPAKIVYYKSGQIKKEDWYNKGRKYRIDGPQQITYEIDGTITGYRWMLEDEIICSFNDWLIFNRENIDKDLAIELKLLYG